MAKKFEKKKTDKKEINWKEKAIGTVKTVGGVLLTVVGIGVTLITKGKFNGPTKS